MKNLYIKFYDFCNYWTEDKQLETFKQTSLFIGLFVLLSAGESVADLICSLI